MLAEASTEDSNLLVELTTDIVAAFLSKNNVGTGDLPKLITEVHSALRGLNSHYAPPPEEERPTPAVSIRKSITPDYIICLEDGKKFKSLKRHLLALGMTPDAYREKWGLPKDYPMVAPNYSATRSQLALAAGLGRKSEPVMPAVKRGRKPKAARPVA